VGEQRRVETVGQRHAVAIDGGATQVVVDQLEAEVKAKLESMGLALKDSAPGFDPTAYVPDGPEDEDLSFAETEQY